RVGRLHGQLVPEPVDRVVGPEEGNGRDREAGPVRKLPGDQPSDEGDVDVHLVGVHPARGHRRPRATYAESPAASIAPRASCSSISPGRPLTPTAPTRTSPSNTATPPRKKVKKGSKLARST